MFRTKVKGTGDQAAAACNRLFHFEPNFYALSPIPPFTDTRDTIAPISPAVSVSVTQDSECDESLDETTIASDTIWNEIDPILLLGRTTHDASLDESEARSPPSSHDSTDTTNSDGGISGPDSEPHVVGELEPLELALEQDEVLDYMVQQFLDSL
jgi:hypothetical protein